MYRKSAFVRLGACLWVLCAAYNDGAASAAGSHWDLPRAPDALATYGFEVGMQVHEDRESSYYLTEYRERDSPVPPELAVVTVVRSDSQSAFIAVETSQASGQVSIKRQLADVAIARFNDIVRQALAGGPGEVRHARRVRQFFYARGRHFKPTDAFQQRFKYRKPLYEQPLLDIWWERAAPTDPFAPDPGYRSGIDARSFPITIAEATQARSPGSPLPRTEPTTAGNAPALPPARPPAPRPADAIASRNGVVTVPVIAPFGIERPPYHWQQRDDGVRRTWEEAHAYCDTLELGGFTDWKLPSFEEISHIRTEGIYPGVRTRFFPGIVDGNYWTSSLRAYLASAALYIAMGKGHGLTNSGLRSQRNFVLCVRRARG